MARLRVDKLQVSGQTRQQGCGSGGSGGGGGGGGGGSGSGCAKSVRELPRSDSAAKLPVQVLPEANLKEQTQQSASNKRIRPSEQYRTRSYA